jgi:hypothetical protein
MSGVPMYYAAQDWRFDWHVYKRTPTGDVILLTGFSNWCGLAAELFNAKENGQWT